MRCHPQCMVYLQLAENAIFFLPRTSSISYITCGLRDLRAVKTCFSGVRAFTVNLGVHDFRFSDVALGTAPYTCVPLRDK